MSLDNNDIRKLATLARIQVDDAIVDDVAGKISDILAMVDQMQAQHTDSIEPMANPLDAMQKLRPDEVTEGNQREAFQAIAPATENGLYLVPKVID